MFPSPCKDSGGKTGDDDDLLLECGSFGDVQVVLLSEFVVVVFCSVVAVFVDLGNKRSWTCGGSGKQCSLVRGINPGFTVRTKVIETSDARASVEMTLVNIHWMVALGNVPYQIALKEIPTRRATADSTKKHPRLVCCIP